MATTVPIHLPYQPRFPQGYNPGIGIIGCGNIVKNAHLKAYQKYGLNVVGVYDVNPEATRGVQEQFGIRHVFASLEDLLAHPDIQVVDIATFPAQRVPLMQQALAVGKHVLAQKPLALTVREARAVVAEAERRGLKVAVNQNGRWAPPWRIATLLVEQGAVGDVLAVTHLFERHFGWVVGTRFDEVPHWTIYDYAIHWLDITRCWMGAKKVQSVRARDFRAPNQPPEAKQNWNMWVEVMYEGGAQAMIRAIGGTKTARQGHPFWIHGTEGTIRGSVLGNDFVELERDGVTCRYDVQGAWFPDGFAGTIGELYCAIVENREPYNSARHNLLSLQMTLAACYSADADGRPVTLEEVE